MFSLKYVSWFDFFEYAMDILLIIIIFNVTVGKKAVRNEGSLLGWGQSQTTCNDAFLGNYLL